MIAPIFFGLPSAAEIHEAPQRAILAALDANLVLAVRMLEARHPNLHDYDSPKPSLLLLAEAVLANAMSLHTILASYDDLAERAARRLDGDDSPPDAVRVGSDDDLDMPF